jgi:hypothetical protein
MPSTTFCTNIPTAVKFTKPKFGAKNKHAFGNDALVIKTLVNY